MKNDTRYSDALLSRVATVVAIVCLAAVVITACLLALPTLRARLGIGTAGAQSYVAGGQIDVASSLYSSTRRTVIFFARFSCAACQQSKPVVAAIMGDLANTPDVRVVLVTGLASPDEEAAFAKQLGLDESAHVRTELASLRLTHVPTLVLVNNRGRVLLARTGLLTEADRTAVVQVATAASASTEFD